MFEGIFRGLFGRKPQVGDVWQYAGADPHDPFDSKDAWFVKVVDIKKRYVQYRYLKDDMVTMFGEPSSTTFGAFRFCFKFFFCGGVAENGICGRLKPGVS